MAPAFAHPATAGPRPISTPAMRLARRTGILPGFHSSERDAWLATGILPSDSTRLRKRRKTEDVPVPFVPKAVALPVAERILAAEKAMSDKLAAITFTSRVAYVYDPLKYAWQAHEWYVNQFGNSRKEILLVGMNPGPWGMAQTGVPFGEVSAVKDWMGMPADISIGKPESEHPKRTILGLSCKRSEVSGRRLWQEWVRKTYGDNPRDFFNRFFVHNYCPLLFLESSGKNRTPTMLRAYERTRVAEICDEGLREVVHALKPRLVCGVGGFATEKCRYALKDLTDKGLLVGTMLHPSPASPQANKGWAAQAAATMQKLVAEMSSSEDIWVRSTSTLTETESR